MMLKRFSAVLATGMAAMPPALALVLLASGPALASNVPQPLPFAQDWTNIGLITTDNDWASVPGIEGFRGDNITAGTGVDPQTLLASDTPGVINVEANELNPTTFTTGGVIEFQIANPVVALNGSGTADAPYIKLYLNTTGCSAINVAYNLRDLDASTDNAVQPYALHFRVGNSGNFTNVPAGFVADASTGPSIATLVTPVSATLPAAADNQAEVQVRVMTANAVGNDESVGIDDISVTGTCGGGPSLSISDVAVTEGNAGTVNATFNVTLSAPAGPGGVTFNYQTADNTATVADNDYVAIPTTGGSIPMGGVGPFAINVAVNGDLTPEANETFLVNITGVVGASVFDAQGQGTINNDDVVITNINQIQGPGAVSPIPNGTNVTTRGIVYAVRNNGFFIQNAGVDNDANPLTSEGLFVFTGSPVPAAATTVGNVVQVSGNVLEFVPASDPLQPSLTELSGGPVTVTLLGTAPVPAATPLPLLNPAGPFDQLEPFEGMRVSVAALTVNGGTDGNVNEANATATSNGVFWGYQPGVVARSLRETGIQPPDPPPPGTGTIPPIPRWDGNPELIRVDSDGLTAANLINPGFGQTVNNLVGPLDYGFRRYSIYPEPGAVPTVTGSIAAGVATLPTASQVTIASYNLERFFDTVNDPAIGEPVLTAVAFDNRLNKASLGIRNSLRTPDIVGVVEVENLSTLQALATRINNDAVAASQPNPMYVAYLVEGNDVGGIDVGFLVKTAPVFGPTPRVAVTEVVQELDGSLFTNLDMSTETLNDRPPLRLTGVVTRSTGQTYPLTVIVNHLRSFLGADDNSVGGNGWPTVGHRVRAKRHAQAVDLANFVQARQAGNPAEQIVLVGDFNNFEFNDGFGHSLGTISGLPAPDNETAVAGDGIDLVNPDFSNLFSTLPVAGRYSYVFDGVAQSIDHALVSASVSTGTVAPRVEKVHINADYPEVERNNAASPNRLSDHDPLLVYLTPNGFVPIEIAIAKTSSTATPVAGGANFSYTLTVTNTGPQAAANVVVSDALPAGVLFQGLASPAGWTCTTPAVGANGTVSCNIASQAVGSAVFTITVSIPANVLPGTITNTATVTTTSVDIDPANNSSSVQVTVQTSADLTVTLVDTPDPVVAGTQLTYTATATKTGPSDAQDVSITLPLPAGTSFVSASADTGGSCAGTTTVTCTWTGATAPGASRVATIVVLVAPAQTANLSATATVASTTSDPNAGNNTATATTTVLVQADLSITLTDAPDPVTAGTQLTYTATVSNAGPSDATAVVVNLPTPTGTSFVSGTVSGGGSCAAGISCSVTGSMAPGSSRTITIVVLVAPSVLDGTVITATATVTAGSPDPNPANNSATTTTAVIARADLQIALTASTLQVLINVPVTFTATSTNLGPSDAQNVSVTITLTPDFRYSSHTFTAAGATCTTPQIGTTGAITCTWPGATAPGVVRTLNVVAYSNNEGNTAVNASTTSNTVDPVPGNNAAGLAVVVGFPFNEIPTLGQYGLILLGLLFGLMGFVAIRRQV